MASHLLRLPSAWRSFMNTGCQVRDPLARHRDSSGSALPQPLPPIVATRCRPARRRPSGARQASSSPRRRATPGLCSSCPFACAEGDGAPKSANLLVSASVAGHGGRLSARHMRLRSSSEAIAQTHAISRRLVGAGPRFRRQCPASLDRTVKSTDGSRLAEVGLMVVSQLLAGPRSGHGRSPGAARVTGLRNQTRGAAPRPASRRLMSTPLRWTRWRQDKSSSERGDKFSSPFLPRGERAGGDYGSSSLPSMGRTASLACAGMS